MSKTKESKLEEQVEKFMNDRGIWQLARYQAQSNQNGLPDRLYLYKGFLLGLELKADGGKPTELQLKKLKAINDNGGIGLIVKNIDIIRIVIDYIDDYSDVNITNYNKAHEGSYKFLIPIATFSFLSLLFGVIGSPFTNLIASLLKGVGL